MAVIELDAEMLRQMENALLQSALTAVEAVRGEIVSAQVVPFDNGTMQGSMFTDQFKDGDEIHTTLITDAPQARRLYYHPEYNFQRGNNANAGAYWYAPWVQGGAQEAFLPETFAALVRERTR